MFGRFYVDMWVIDRVERWYGYEIVNKVMTTVQPFGVNLLGHGFEPNYKIDSEV